MLLLLLAILRRQKEQQWGFMTEVSPMNEDTVKEMIFKPQNEDGTRITRSNHINFKRLETDYHVSRKFSLGGRGTHAILGTIDYIHPRTNQKVMGDNVVLRFAHGEQKRIQNEINVLRMSNSKPVELKKVTKDQKKEVKPEPKDEIVEYLPELLGHVTFPDYSTDKICRYVGLEIDEKGTRTPYMIFTPRYNAITDNPNNLVKAEYWYEILRRILILIHCMYYMLMTLF